MKNGCAKMIPCQQSRSTFLVVIGKENIARIEELKVEISARFECDPCSVKLYFEIETG